MVAGKTKFVFLNRNCLYLLAICSTNEPIELIQAQLEYIYSQIVFLLTSKFEDLFISNASYDLRNLLFGTLLFTLLFT